MSLESIDSMDGPGTGAVSCAKRGYGKKRVTRKRLLKKRFICFLAMYLFVFSLLILYHEKTILGDGFTEVAYNF